MPLLETKGAASAQGFGGAGAGSSGPVNYIEDVFSTYLYTGNGSTQTITNGIDLSTKGGLVWFKCRSSAFDNRLFDTARGATQSIASNLTTAQTTGAGTIAFGTTGFTTPNNEATSSRLNETYVSWTFREQPKFFDIVTYTGTGGGPSSVSHLLGSVPGFVIIKSTSRAGNWVVAARQSDGTYATFTDSGSGLQSTAAAYSTTATPVSAGALTATTFNPSWFNNSNIPGAVQNICDNGVTYVVYLFAHNAGGFGLTGSDNVISCGSYNATGSGAVTINLGWEPQWVLVKRAVRTGGLEDTYPDGWSIFDNMRGITANGTARNLRANLSNAEVDVGTPAFTATGMSMAGNWNTLSGGSSATYIYIAIRRGPMKVPTSGASVFGLSARTGTGANATVTGLAGVSDAVLIKNRGSAVGDLFASRLTGTGYLETSSTAAEVAAGTTILQANPWDVMDGVNVGTTSTITNASANTYINYLFDRAPGFFDEVCYTGNGPGTQVINHNLTVVPELVINKVRSTTSGWTVFQGDTTALTGFLRLNETSAAGGDTLNVSSTTITVDSTIGFGMNTSGQTYVTYLFASCPGVSKVGRFTGTGATQVINCGFTGGARFVLIKARSTTGDWYVWDSARGIVAGNDPYLELNTTDAEVTGTDWVDTASTGFELSNAAGNLANSNGVTYIFLAIA